ncbi:MAG: helix-turn-helix domain-containing protein [Treponema sp.]|nr:helix-turn-helix domain-containing protein [Treponema sp.]
MSDIINGVRRSKKAEAKIAAFFGKEPGEIFPPRTRDEIEAMRKTAAGRGAA